MPPYPLSDHYDGKLFFNPGVNTDHPFTDLIRWKWAGTAKDWPDSVANTATPELPVSIMAGQIYFTFINHVTFLVQLDQLNILTDPVYSERTSPVSFAGPKRVRPPGLPFEQLPKIDLVVVSHNHYDHMDLATLKRLKDQFDPIFLVPLGNKQYFQKMGDAKVYELDWWQEFPIKNLKVTLTPAQHWSSRTPFDKREALWGGFYFTGAENSLFFAGDTGYGPHFAEIQQRLGSPKIALLPIGAYEPRWFMKTAHMNPDDAVMAFQDLQAKQAVAMHFGTWQLTDEALEAPVQDLGLALEKRKIPAEQFQVLKVGQTKGF